MGVTGLWQIVQPCARPIKIETLNRKRLAVDASIWIYQFLKAVRDKEGNALRNSHVVGFFRRICKLLFFGIKPVFVFDGGAPAVKRQTIRSRKARREGRREDAVRTAGKLLAVQIQRRAEEEEAQRRAERNRTPEQEEEVPDEGLVYVDELQMTQQERQQNRKFRKKDQYHLPDLDMSLSEIGGPNDLRVMSLEELQAYARQFDTGEDINVYDFSKIDYDSPFFMSLPPSDRYNILNAARLRSRLRMGHSKEQLDSMFPDRMAFSKFQIERVRERNELTQRLMHLNGFETMEFGGRVAGEKGREYVLVKNDGVEGGWALGVISDEGKQDKPIDVDRPAPTKDENDDEEWENDDEFEDVPIEGLNRLPKRKTVNDQVTDDLMKQRRATYSSRRTTARRNLKRKATPDPNSLFVQSSDEEAEVEGAYPEEADADDDLLGEKDEDDELQRAITMSLEKDNPEAFTLQALPAEDIEDDDMLEVFQQKAVEEQRPVPRGRGRDIASIVNKRAFNTAPESREITSFGVPKLKPDDSDDDEDTIDFQAALVESRKNNRKTSPPRRQPPPLQPTESPTEIAKKAGFKGPLPFEKLDLGSSLLGKKKMQERTEEAAGGFENPELARKQQKKAEPLPPWFSGSLEENIRAPEVIEAEDHRKAREYDNQFQFQDRGQTIRRVDTNEVIDLEADDVDKGFKTGEVIDLDADKLQIDNGSFADRDTRMGDMADEVRAGLQIAIPPEDDTTTVIRNAVSQSPIADPPANSPQQLISLGTPRSTAHADVHPRAERERNEASQDDDEMIEWSESDREDNNPATVSAEAPSGTFNLERSVSAPAHRDLRSETGGASAVLASPQATEEPAVRRSPSADAENVEFEDINIPDEPPTERLAFAEELDMPPVISEDDMSGLAATPGPVAQDSIAEDDQFDDFSDPEDAEILRALTLEAEEHARFASTLNNKSQAQNVQDYERELKQLRNQQKKDRRDADEVTQVMIQECQALLRLFGLPYITAPMEAEAQCAELVRLGLVDGIVTDDSDCFLFGGTRIYKNMFNQAKFVECYLTSDLEKEFALTRDKLIAVAHLLGSDYTEGLPGIGPVSAIEIVSEFETLEAFKEWWSGVQMSQIPKSEDVKNPFRKKFRRNATKLFLPPSFPDQRVNMAYLNPEVDADPEAFQWGVPDLDALRSFLMSTIGWSQERTDEVLVPVIRDMNRRADEGTQANITHFFDGTVGIGAAGSSRTEGFAPRKRVEGSKRMGSALNKMAERAKLVRNGSVSEEPAAEQTGTMTEASDAERSGTTSKAPRKRKSAKAAAPRVSPPAAGSDDEDGDFTELPQQKKPKTRAPKTTGRKTRAAANDE